ncbi:hypothetical protein OQA88_11532 [Cercophora sp. LCS_1]
MDDEFSDDGFDDLNDTVLQELEDNAIQFTQAQKLAQSQAAASQAAPARQTILNQYGFDDDDLDDTVVIDERSLQPPPALPRPNAALPQQPWNQQPQYPRPPSQFHPQRSVYPPRPQYPAPPRPAGHPLPSQQFPSQRFPTSTIAQRPAPTQSQFARPLPSVTRPQYGPQASQALHGAGPAKQNEIIAALRARLSALESDLTASKGEALLLRSKYEKAQATHEAEVTRLKKLNAENAAKQERVVEEALAKQKHATTELEFARQDLSEQLGRAKSRRKGTGGTPGKNRSWGMADGFDGLEMSGSSPTKTQTQKKKDPAPSAVERTPTKGKRKRPAVDSPTFALETHSGDEAVARPSVITRSVSFDGGADGLPYDFLKLALDHSVFHGQPLTFDLFSRFAFPSDPSQAFSSLIFQKLPQMGSAKEPLRLLIDFAELMVDMWQRCLKEKYLAPIYYLGALISYVLQLNAVTVAPHIISSLLPVCITTCQLVALPRFHSADGDISQHPDETVRQLTVGGEVPQSMSLLYLSALGCLSSPADLEIPLPSDVSPQVQFWKTVDMHFVIVMLSPKHPELEWLTALALLCTSVLPDSLGPIPNAIHEAEKNAASQSPEVVADAVTERVSFCLFDIPRWASPGSTKELHARLAVLKTLIIFATSPFGLLRIASNDKTIQRLVTTLCWAIDRLYDVDTPLTIRDTKQDDRSSASADVNTSNKAEDPFAALDRMELDPIKSINEDDVPVQIDEDADDDVSTLLCRIIALVVRLLHTLITDSRCASRVDMGTQLASLSGGPQRYLLALARLNFAEEDLVLESGIDAETADLAHDLLELAVTPDDGEGMMELFST